MVSTLCNKCACSSQQRPCGGYDAQEGLKPSAGKCSYFHQDTCVLVMTKQGKGQSAGQLGLDSFPSVMTFESHLTSVALSLLIFKMDRRGTSSVVG